jgi:O-antigen/teichoic acid export membrane protein
VWQRVKGWLRQPYAPFFTALGAFSLACVFGTPIYALVYALPFLSQSHSPFRWVFPLTVSVAALAGFGMMRLTEACRCYRRDSIPSRRRAASRSWWLRAIFIGAEPDVASGLAAGAIWGALLVSLGLVGSRLAYDRLAPLIERAFWSLAKAAHTFPDARTFYAYLVPQVARGCLFLFGSGVVLRFATPSTRSRQTVSCKSIWQWLAVALVVADLVVFGVGFNPAVDPDLLAGRPPVVDFLKRDSSPWRLSTFDPQGRNTFNTNVSMLYGLQDVRGYDSLFSAQYARYMGWIEPQDQLPYNRIAPFRYFSSLDSPLTDLLNVKYILTEEEIPLPKYELVYQDAALRVYENLGVAPRAFTLPLAATVEVADGEAVGEALLTYDPRFYVVVETSQEGWIGERSSTTALAPTASVPAELTAQPIPLYEANEVIIDATVDGSAWLVLTDSFAPGWKAFVRPLGAGADQETEVAIARVAGNFRGVLLEDSATVRFKYSPNSVKIGAFLSFLSGMVVVFLVGVWTWRLVYRDRDDGTTVQRLAKNSIVPIVLNIFNRAVDFAFAALMLRILGPANAGDYYYAINIFLWFDILTNFGLNTYLTREVSRHRDQTRRYLFNTTALRLGLSLIGIPLLVGVLVGRQTLIAALASPASRQAIIATGLLYIGSIPYSISTGLTALFYAYEKAEVPAAVASVSELIKVTLQVLVLIVGWGIVGLATASIAVNIVTLIILATFAWRRFPAVRRARTEIGERFRLSRPTERALRREMVRESWPLMVNHLLATFFFKIDVFLMEFILGREPLGLYSIGYKFLDAVMVIPSMFTLALFPVISRQAHDDRDALMRFYRFGTKILVLIALPLALITTVAGREMVLILGGVQYMPGAMIALRLMAWSMPIGWINSITQYVLIAIDQQRYLTRAYLLGFGFSLAANLFLMPRFGYPASALLHIFAELVLFVPFLIGLRRHLGVVGWWRILGKPVLAAVGAGAAALLLWPFGRMLSLFAVIVVYAVLVWGLKIMAHEERALLSPLFHRHHV